MEDQNTPASAPHPPLTANNKPSDTDQRPHHTGFLGYFLWSYRVTFLLILGLAILGVTTVTQLPRESTPEIEVPFGVVVTAYPGASARDVEELVTKEVEQGLENLEGLKTLTSSSRLGISTVNVEFSADENVDEALRRLREAADKITGLPDEAETPEVVEINFSNEPILSVGLGGLDDERLLTLYAEDLADTIKQVSGVSDVTVVGARGEEIVVHINPHKLAQLNLSIGQVLAAIQGANINAPFGQLDTAAFNYDLRLQGRFEHIGDVAAIPIALNDGTTIPLDELADVSLQLSEVTSRSRLSLNQQPSTPAVSLQITKKTGGNIVEIVDAIQAEIAKAQENILPPDITIESFADRAEEIRRSLSDVSRSGLQTLIIVFLVLWLFLGWREAVITAVAVPLTFFIAFLIFKPTGTTLNGISLFSLILSLGLLVDNAIVITEGIHTGVGKPNLRQHAHRIVSQFRKPLMGGTLTTVAAFFPMLLVSGIIGQFLSTIPIVVSATLVSSLFVALALTPAVAVFALASVKPNQQIRWFDRRFTIFRAWYSRIIDRVLKNRRLQNRIIAALVLALILGLSLPFTGLLRTGLFPTVDIDFMIINAELPPGSKQEETAKIVSRVEEILLQAPEVTSFVANIGASSSLDLGGGASSENLASFFINLNKDRSRTSLAITEELRNNFREITDARVEVAEISAGPPTGAPVEFRVVGPDLTTLDNLSRELMDERRTIPGSTEIDRNLRESSGEFNFTFNQEELARQGLTSASVAQLLRLSIFGLEATTFLDDKGDEVSIRLAADKQSVASVNEILGLPITTRSGTITLSQIANVDLSTSLSAIRRRDGERTISISANAREGITPNEITQQMQQRIAERDLPVGYRVEFGGEQQETEETFAELYNSMFIAVILILIILVIEFNSYRQPLVIFLSIPLALIGVLFGLLIFGGQLNFAAFIGLVSLTGIVVNNAILLVDRMNKLIAEGHQAISAVAEGVNSRLRPVILTTITTAGGVLPLIWVDEFFRDMALTIITGLLFSSILTLLFIPILYLRQHQKIERKKALKPQPTIA